MSLDRAFLDDLLSAAGPSSYESRPAAVWARQARSRGAETRIDTYGNVLARFNPGGSPRAMLVGHIDEIGLIVTHVDPAGLLSFRGVGGWDPQVLVGQRVRVLAAAGDVIGVIGKKAIHLQTAEERRKVTKLDSQWIDIGARDRDDALERVAPGDAAVIEQPPLTLLNGRIAGRAIDDRIGAYAALEAAARSAAANPGTEVIAVASVQEEISGVGADTAVYAAEPDLLLVIETTHATDIPGVDERREGETPLGSGPNLAVGSYVHRGLLARLKRVAAERDIPYSVNVSPRRTASDADRAARVRSGVPTAVVSIPCRYLHSPNELIDPADVEQAILLIGAALSGLEVDTDLRQP